jgi:hypothetical protein
MHFWKIQKYASFMGDTVHGEMYWIQPYVIKFVSDLSEYGFYPYSNYEIHLSNPIDFYHIRINFYPQMALQTICKHIYIKFVNIYENFTNFKQ